MNIRHEVEKFQDIKVSYQDPKHKYKISEASKHFSQLLVLPKQLSKIKHL